MRALLVGMVLLSGCAGIEFNAPQKDLYITDAIFPDENNTLITEFVNLIHNTKSGETINIYINSPGGSVSYAIQIIELMKSAQAKGIKVNTVCLTVCASMAAVILEFGDKRQALSTAIIMFHHIYYGDDQSRRDEKLLIQQHAFLEEMAERSGFLEDIWLFLYKVKGDLWFTARDSLRIGLIDELVTLKI